MTKLSREEIIEKIAKLDKFKRDSRYGYFIYIDGTGFMYNASTNTWWKLRGPYVHTYPLTDDFYEKIRKETGGKLRGDSSIEEVLETVPDDIRDTILFNINLFR